MRTLKIENCSYAKFELIRDAYYKLAPFAIVHAGYSKKLKMAIFNLWDHTYIPIALNQYEVPFNRDLLVKLDVMLRPELDALKKFRE